MITPQALTAFAAEQLNMQLSAPDADRLSRLYTAYIRAQLATLKQQTNDDSPPFKVSEWRALSQVKRLVFGTVADNKRTSGVVRLDDHLSGVLHKRKGRPGYFAFFFPSDLWSASVLDDDKRRQQLENMMSKHFTKRMRATPMTIPESRLRCSIPTSKQKWAGKRFSVDFANSEWPIQPNTDGPAWATLEGAELADVILLFGLHERLSSYQQKLPVALCVDSKNKTIMFNNNQLWLVLTNSAQ